MSSDATTQPAVAQPTEPASAAATSEGAASESVAPAADAKSAESDAPAVGQADGKSGDDQESNTEPTAAEPSASATKDSIEEDVDMKDKPAEETAEPTASSEKAAETDNTAAADSAAADATPSKTQPRRKSTGVADKGKKLNKKASKAKILHLDASPGEHYFAKLKGFPPWPVVICEEDMLPQNMLNSRPVTAARADGIYREDFADGGKRAADRTFPVMYLHTNEFSWTPNTDLSELDASTVSDLVTAKMRKDLQAAHHLAAEGHDLDYYKNVLREFEEQRLAKLEAKKSKVKTPKKPSKAADEDGDLDMEDAEEGSGEPAEKKSKSKKRKAEEDASTPQQSDSVKKPKIKLTGSSTPKNANGVQSPSAAKEATKSVKVKAKSSKVAKDADSKEKEAVAPKEPELTPEEKRVRKEKEILFLRHRLQRGLLPREGSPVAEEMKQVSDFLAKLETFPDLDVSIIRATKINKVLKAILKLETIPKEEEFQFKPRSQTLLDKWNILLASDAAPAATNGVSGKSSKETTNGVKNDAAESKADAEEEKGGSKDEAKDSVEGKDTPSKEEEGDAKTSPETATATAEASA
ncbi:hypothetical protein F5Y18DRAFT_438543 [Xylariaceae sp. FL1019]|nr:hypothetical protein F5Y18DRAFT_438543 [Xylariaceae sp. FL1019]